MKSILSFALLLSALATSAQDGHEKGSGGKELAHLDIHTSTVCDMCEKTIEENLIYEKGVKKVNVDLAKSEIHVEYDPKKNTPEALRTAVSKLGYMADEVPGDEAAFKKLPLCCQKEGCGKPAAKP
ncbi:MAG: heavy-metal-associated domain-containing protein [Flavobacteriales bacterium]|nr:heavy-metal-associated domain-containing protein [Flavobacteriales bacterium]